MKTSHTINIKPSAIETIYDGLNRIGALGETSEAGFSRPAFSDTETAAMQHIETLARIANLQTRWDTVGNLIVETAGDYTEWVETGSHIDTVTGGGNFDGTAGVVAGLAVLQAVQGTTLSKGLRLRVWRGEESAAFGVVSIGSRAAFGTLPASALKSTHQSRTLLEAMCSQGADPDVILNRTPTISDEERNSIAAHIELHIEQGNVLERDEKEIGIVTGIRGSIRSWVKLRGAFDHSGGTPMGRTFRRDVNLAMAHMQVRLDELVQAAISDGMDIVQTVGVVNTNSDINRIFPEMSANAVTKVSGAGYFSHEVRSASPEQAERFSQQTFTAIAEIAKEHGVEIEIDTFASSPGIESLDSELQQLAESSCKSLSLSCTKLPSGAWHDAAVLCGMKRGDSSEIPVGMLFIPCRNGISHSASEYASPEQIAAGATLLAHMMISLAA